MYTTLGFRIQFEIIADVQKKEEIPQKALLDWRSVMSHSYPLFPNNHGKSCINHLIIAIFQPGSETVKQPGWP